MRSVVRTLLSLTLAVLIASPLFAGEKKEGKGPKKFDPAEGILKRLEKAGLTEDQVAKIKELAAASADKIAAARAKAPLTPEQKKAGEEARKKAKDEGKPGKEIQAAVDAAMNLTEDQKAAQKELQEIQSGLNKEAMSLLTPEQKEKLGIKPGKKGEGRKKKDA
jgi:Spy/CpxP family protein refolding chaperone